MCHGITVYQRYESVHDKSTACEIIGMYDYVLTYPFVLIVSNVMSLVCLNHGLPVNCSIDILQPGVTRLTSQNRDSYSVSLKRSAFNHKAEGNFAY